MDDVPIPSRDGDPLLFKQFLAQYGPPAYVRRARLVEETFEHLLNHCRQKRDELLALVRLRVGQLRALAGEWAKLRPLVSDDEQLVLLEQLHCALQPKLRLPVKPTPSRRILRQALRELRASVESFNRRWDAFVRQVDLAHVNAARDAYNRYYVVEKECALRSPALARMGFCRLEPLTVADVSRHLPPLPVPQLQG